MAATKADYEIAFPEDALADFIFSERSDIPQTAVFNRKGRMVQKLVGFSDGIQKELDQAVEIAVNSQ